MTTTTTAPAPAPAPRLPAPSPEEATTGGSGSPADSTTPTTPTRTPLRSREEDDAPPSLFTSEDGVVDARVDGVTTPGEAGGREGREEDEDDDEEDEEGGEVEGYATSYSRLAAPKGGVADGRRGEGSGEGKARLGRRRRRGGYGRTPSALERLPEGGGGDDDDDNEGAGEGDGNANDDGDEFAPDLDVAAMEEDDGMGAPARSSIFAEAWDDGDDSGSEDESDGDGNDNEMRELEEEERGRGGGRTKRTSKAKAATPKAKAAGDDDEAGGDEDDEAEDGEFPQSEASRFSQGTSQPTAAMASDAEAASTQGGEDGGVDEEGPSSSVPAEALPSDEPIEDDGPASRDGDERRAPEPAVVVAADPARLSRVAPGVRVSVRWPDDDAYYPGIVGASSPGAGAPHLYRIDYDDGEFEELDLSKERFRILEDPEERPAAEEQLAEDREPSSPSAEPSETQILRVVDSLFLEVEQEDIDQGKVTVGHFHKRVAERHGWDKTPKPIKKLIKGRLQDLMQGVATPGDVVEDYDDEERGSEGGGKRTKKDKKSSKKDKKRRQGEKDEKRKKPRKKVPSEDREDKENEEEEQPYEEGYESEPGAEEGNDSSSDYEDARRSKGRGKKSKKMRGHPEDDSEDSDDDDNAPESKQRPKKKRSKRRRSSAGSKAKGRMARHMRDRHADSRKRLLEEARIRREELGHLADEDNDGDGDGDDGETKKEEDKKAAEAKEGGHRLSEEDRKRALAIAARFDTEDAEKVARRAAERAGLIGRLRARRLEGMDAGEEESGAAAAEAAAETAAEAEGSVGGGEARGHGPKGGDAAEVKPRLSFCDRADPAGGEAVEAADKKVVDLSDDEDGSGCDDGDDESDDDLDIVAPGAGGNVPGAGVKKASVAISLLDQRRGSAVGPRRPPPAKGGASLPATHQKAALMKALRARKAQLGNRWLARELAPRKVNDVASYATRLIRECKKKEDEKRRQILSFERKAALEGRAMADYEEEMLQESRGYDEEEDEEMAQARDMGQLKEGIANEEEGDGNVDAPAGQVDGEIAKMEEAPPKIAEPGPDLPEESIANRDEGAKENNVVKQDDDAKTVDGNANEAKPYNLATPADPSSLVKMSPGSIVTPQRSAEEVSSGHLRDETALEIADASSSDLSHNDDGDVAQASNPANHVAGSEDDNSGPGLAEDNNSSQTDRDISKLDTSMNDQSVGNAATDGLVSSGKESPEPLPAVEEKLVSDKPKNSAWQAMLRKEEEALKREKKLMRRGGGGLVEGEAEEEEEDDMGIAGLEEFGFAVEKKDKGEKDDDAVDVDEDDLEHVVDDVSDGEGDEEAGDDARKRLERAEEKQLHKDIMQKVTEGYSGRRGGISRSGGRGLHKFDELVADDGKKRAKVQGLLTLNEMDSEDEDDEGKVNKGGNDEEEDEAVMLHNMLKDRHLNLEEEDGVEENFTDDEESEDEADKDQKDGDEDAEDREQERLAKHFDKRARRNRILEEFEGDSQFSRSRLIDEDVSMQQDLRTMKV
ncbi:hypothetical protein ACHAWF_018888 [Thalassiosira exigua]